MDMLLIPVEGGTQLRPCTVHAMLWLQTHFENSAWEALASNHVIVSVEDAQEMSEDAMKAGIRLAFAPNLSIAGGF